MKKGLQSAFMLNFHFTSDRRNRSLAMSVGQVFISCLRVSLVKGKMLKFSLSFDYPLPGEPIGLSCLGEIVRVEPHNRKFGIAAKIKDLKFIH